MNGISKFDQLRIKTDKELLHLLRKELDLGISAASEALLSADDGIPARESYVKAKRTYTEVSRWLCLIYEITTQERARLELSLNRLRVIMKGLAVLCPDERSSRSDIGALALAFWHARGCPEGSSERDWLRAEQMLGSRPASQSCVLA